jgi:ribosomal protein L11 methyltransferase
LTLACGNRRWRFAVDLGTGTGLLAIAAARLGCRRNLAVDLNFLAAKTAHRNARLNHLESQVFVWCGSAYDVLDQSVDLVIANIHYDVMKNLIIRPEFLQKKWFILSGLLRSEAAKVEGELSRQPVTIMKKWVRNGIWYTFLGRVD